MKQRQATRKDYEIVKKYELPNIQDLHPVILEFGAGEFLCHEECNLPYLIFICTGRAKVFCNLENGKRLLMSFYESGGVIGDLEFLMERDTAANSIQAITPLTCFAIPTGKNRTVLNNNNHFLRILSKGLAKKFQRSTTNCAHIILYPLEVRLCSYIDTGCTQDIFNEKLTEVAEVLGTSYRHLIRALNRLIADGIIKKENHKYIILDRKELNYRSKNFYKPIEGSA